MSSYYDSARSIAPNAGPDNSSVARTVADHYNKIQEHGQDARKESRVFYMRSFNNWIKATLLSRDIGRINCLGFN